MTDEAAHMRLIHTGFRRFSAEPETRAASSRLILTAALALHADYTSPGEAALTAAELLSTLAARQRRKAG